MIKDKQVTDLLFAYLNLFEAPLLANLHWIRRAANLRDLEWMKAAEGKTAKEQIALIQQRLTEHLDDYFYRYHSDTDFKTGLTFDHEIQSWQGPTDKRLRFTVSYTAPNTYTITQIEDQLNGERAFGFEFPHEIGTPTDGVNLESGLWQ